MALVVCLIGITFLAVTPVEAATYKEMKITYSNLWTLQSTPDWVYVQGALPWYFGKQLDATYEYNYLGYTQHADNLGSYRGECVSSCKALSKNNIGTSSWRKGNRVINGGVTPGTVIATFLKSDGGYLGHAAIFRSYVRNSSGQITGFKVWDQNWVKVPCYSVIGNTVFGTHAISLQGSGVINGSNYFTVLVPSP
jgi:hypothetical protein